MQRFLAIVLMAMSAQAAGETMACFAINTESVVDKHFIANVKARSIPYSTQRENRLCVDGKYREQVIEARDKATTLNPQQCVLFSTVEAYIAMRKILSSEKIESWMNKPEGPLCYLLKDTEQVWHFINANKDIGAE